MNFGSFHNLLFSFCEVDEVVGIVIILFRSAKPSLSATEMSSHARCVLSPSLAAGLPCRTRSEEPDFVA